MNKFFYLLFSELILLISRITIDFAYSSYILPLCAFFRWVTFMGFVNFLGIHQMCVLMSSGAITERAILCWVCSSNLGDRSRCNNASAFVELRFSLGCTGNSSENSCKQRARKGRSRGRGWFFQAWSLLRKWLLISDLDEVKEEQAVWMSASVPAGDQQVGRCLVWLRSSRRVCEWNPASEQQSRRAEWEGKGWVSQGPGPCKEPSGLCLVKHALKVDAGVCFGKGGLGRKYLFGSICLAHLFVVVLRAARGENLLQSR